MSKEETCETRQRNELEALHAIYGDQLKDLRKKSAWNKWIPLNLTISLTPQQGSSGPQEIYAQLDLHIICPVDYPNSLPKICLENHKGLSNTTLIELQEKLEDKCKEFKGEEMIFQLSQFVEEFLHRYNKPSSKSFYDEMLQRKKEKEEKELLEETRQRQSMIEEVQRRQEILKSEFRLRKESRYNSDMFDDDTETFRNYNNSTESSDDSLCIHNNTTIIDFGHRQIQRGRCLKHKNLNRVVFSGIDNESGEIIIVGEWKFEIKNNIDAFQKQICSIEQEFNYLTKLKHRNLAHYYAIKHEINDNMMIIQILKEFVYGLNCSALYLSQNIAIDTDFLRHVAKGVLRAIDYLHRNNVVHKEIKDTCVYINEKGVVKLNNYSIHKRLSDLENPAHSNYGKKTDIYNFGLFLLALLKGITISEENIEIPTSISSDLYDFFSRMLIKDEKERFTAAQLLNHPFLNKKFETVSPLHQNVQQMDLQRNISPEIIPHDIASFSQSQITGQSRIQNEFEFLQHLGKGAFGDVIKVRNKLDGGYYAIKRIQLNPKNKQLNKKIVREVKLLSRLNHENVVRYYNSWIETTIITENSCELNSSTSSVPKVKKKDEFTINDDIEALAPPIKNVEVSIKYDSKSQAPYNSSSSEDFSDDESNYGGYFDYESDDGIEFERSEKSVSRESQSQSENKDTATPSDVSSSQQIDFMYIQMEFCEKSTLRIAIDNNLYLDENRVCRLFREIVEGLAHIHQQGMIHRDLKPVNIFLDSEDHVKIGDFGLATTNIKSKLNEFGFTSAIESEREETNDESKTGLIGTALYVAPEIGIASKTIYNQKVDIYSLGIILFEMCYKPLETTMERIKILMGLRSKDIILPEDFLNKKNQKQEYLIKWLLTHDITKRPTSQELLQSEHVPPPVLEERELRELVRHTLNNPHLKGYKYLIASCFQQSLSSAQDITYDKDPSIPVRPYMLYESIRQKTVQVFRQHGGQNLSTPLLMPKGKHYEDLESCVKLMTHFGSIVTLPHDLRLPFARYIAWNGITMLRRYSIERVYREKRVFGFQPRELYECAFDIVTPTAGINLLCDAEILYIVYEIISALPGLENKHFIIRLNHTLLLKAILLYCGIKDKHEEILKVISDIKERRVVKMEMQNYLITLGLPDNQINMLINTFNSEYEIAKAINFFQMITKKKSSEASQLAKEALKDLRLIAQNATAFGVTFEIMIAPGLIYNVEQYSGMVCQFVCDIKKKHKHNNLEVLAAGGRYDSMIAGYRTIMEQTTMVNIDIHQSAVGISLSLDKLVQAVQQEMEQKTDNLDVVLCSVGIKPLLKEKTQILKSLWSASIQYLLIEAASIEEVQEQINDLKVNHVVILKDTEQGTVLVRSSNNKFVEKKYQLSIFVQNISNLLKFENSQLQSQIPASKSDSKIFHNERNEHSQEANVDVLFVLTEKVSPNVKKRFENQIRSYLDGLFKRLTGNVTVLGLQIESNVIKTLSSYLEFESEFQYQKSVKTVIEKHQKYKKYINIICDSLYEVKTKSTNPLVVLYSLTDNFYKLVI